MKTPFLSLPVLSLLVLGLLVSCSSTPPITDQGNQVPGSIAVLESIVLNGRTEWITIRGRDRTKPLLLFLAGGPGGSELATVRETLGGLEDHFVVVVWDQPGAGKSYGAVPHRDLTVEMFLEDGCALVQQLCTRFQREKLTLVGESWGSFLAFLVASQVPDRIHSVFGTGQMVAFLETDLACYQLALDWAAEREDEEKLQKLKTQGPPPYSGTGVATKIAEFLMDTYQYMRKKHGIRTGGNTWRDLAGSEYTLVDKVNWFRGLWDSLEYFYPHLWDWDLRTAVPNLAVPAYFFLGRYDVNAPGPLVEDYYQRLEAPLKEIVWFERSGHTPWSSESDRFIDELVKRAEP